jgi:hypothetical protein
VVRSYRVKRKAGWQQPSISPSPNTREVEHTKTEARTPAAAACSIFAIIGALLIRNYGKTGEQK